eukprot:CAMPEP_0184675864 /NCGR_PEP_ID=MMETSP0308-20130426/88040_1 /TAXON_ID=38269 /ORGANISM="Gloeochaete witrockiana, Strain SAG 46.84" /LENGTH=49 /DNA_ID=CAMNT_0027123645 /DNA_START=501 /DNA_END=650 /DNA_ORIENTATION=-
MEVEMMKGSEAVDCKEGTKEGIPMGRRGGGVLHNSGWRGHDSDEEEMSR